MTQTKTKTLTLTALMAAVICILAPLSIPIPVSSVALTLGTFALYLTAYVLEPKLALAAVGIYLLIGASGVPVFSGYTTGIQKFAGASGGYLVGYLFLTPGCSVLVRRFPRSPVLQAVGMFCMTLIFYCIAVLWMSVVTGGSFLSVLPAGALVFLPLDCVKMIAACWMGQKIQSYLKNAA